MTRDIVTPTRRRLLAAAAAGVLAPTLAGAQRPPVAKETALMQVHFAFADQRFSATLEDNPTARDFAALLPLDLTIEDYSTNEKISYLPRKLTMEGARPFGHEAPGDICYYAPWGNLALYHAGYRHSSGLVRLGRLDAGFAPLLKRGTFPLRVERQA